VLGWDQTQARSWNGICRHTALAALAQLRSVAIRNALTGRIQLPGAGHDISDTADDGDISDAGLLIPSVTRPSRSAAASPARPASPPSGCRSPRPPGSPALPGSTPPG